MSERVTQRHSEAVSHAFTWVPARVLELAGCDIFCGDPVFAGLHRIERTLGGRSYRDTAHVCYPHHVADRRVTMVLPDVPPWYTVIHELGHALDWHVSERSGQRLTFRPVTAYARTDRMEAFAEAFCAWFWPFGEFRSDIGAEPDRESYEFFDRLATAGW